MLRVLVVFLVLANIGYYGWSQRGLRQWGWTPVEEAEPQRLGQQIRPETLKLLPAGSPEAQAALASPPAAPAASGPQRAPLTATAAPAEAISSTASTSAPTVCLQAGLFNDAQADAVRRAASTLPANSWSLERTTLPARWMVYMGRFNDMDTLEKKRNELRKRGVAFERAGEPNLELGLSLGRYPTQVAAQRALQQLNSQQRVRSARVVQERWEQQGFMLRVPAADAALREQLPNVLRPALGDKPLQTCS